MNRRSREGLREVIRDYRRDQIVEEARRLFNERGSADVSMDEIAAASGVARSTVYVYFSGRHELLQACIHQLAANVQDEIAEAFDRCPDPADRLRAVVSGLLSVVEDNPAFFLLVLATQSAGGREGDAVGVELASIGLSVIGFIQTLVADGMASGWFRPLDESRVPTLIGQQLLGAMSVRAGDPSPPPLATDVDDVAEFLLHALRANPEASVAAAPAAAASASLADVR